MRFSLLVKKDIMSDGIGSCAFKLPIVLAVQLLQNGTVTNPCRYTGEDS